MTYLSPRFSEIKIQFDDMDLYLDRVHWAISANSQVIFNRGKILDCASDHETWHANQINVTVAFGSKSVCIGSMLYRPKMFLCEKSAHIAY